ncbi:putative ABC transporter permease [Anaerocolumna sp.]|uniref:putative ABC transporter permease n=1 Tax=Anaerocolumna sp. TaxID=2041569 RepID=UPI0028A58D08|nr:hypothetical protein [Anaerocolumna sp.]
MYEYLWFFIIYAFFGWCTEVAFAAVDLGKFVNRGFLNGPLCPVYGFGVAAVISLLTPIQESKWMLFIGAVLVTTIIEFLTGWVLEKMFKQRWWDYSDLPFNIKGYVCLKFSVLWGLACLFVMEIVQPGIIHFIAVVPTRMGWVMLAIFYLILFVDVFATAQTVLKINKQLEEANKIAEKIHSFSDGIGKKISTNSIRVASKLEESKKVTEELKTNVLSNLKGPKEQLENLKEQRDKILSKNFFGRSRIIKAFPQISSSKYKLELEHLKEKIIGKNQDEDER